MTERWQRELRKLRDVAPPGDGWDRVHTVPPDHAHESPSPRSRVAAAFVALAVFSAAAVFGWQALRPRGADTAAPRRASQWPALVFTAWPELDEQGMARGGLSYANITQGLLSSADGLAEFTRFPSAVPQGTTLSIADIGGSVQVTTQVYVVAGNDDAVTTGEPLMVSSGGGRQPWPDLPGTYGVTFDVSWPDGRVDVYSVFIEVVPVDRGDGVLTLTDTRRAGGGLHAVLLSVDQASGGDLEFAVATDDHPSVELGRPFAIESGASITVGGDMRRASVAFEPRSSGPVEEFTRDDRFPVPETPGTYTMRVDGRWADVAQAFVFEIEVLGHSSTTPVDASPGQPSAASETTAAESETPIGSIPDILRVRCNSDRIEVLTPVVAAQPDGLHILAEITELHDPEVSVRSVDRDDTVYLSGSSGTDEEFVRELPVGESIVHCESGPEQQDGPEDLDAPFTLVDPNGVYVEERLDCESTTDMAVEGALRADAASPKEAVTGRIRGLLADDVVEVAGYPAGESPWLRVRVVRGGSVIGRFHVDGRGGWRYSLRFGSVCTGAGLSIDPAIAAAPG